MITSCELSLYPLTEAYEEKVIAFIESIRNNHPEIHVEVTGLSTLLVGEWTALMKVIEQEVYGVINQKHAVVVMKWAEGDHSKRNLPKILKNEL